jgi:hypothetical protein
MTVWKAIIRAARKECTSTSGMDDINAGAWAADKE